MSKLIKSRYSLKQAVSPELVPIIKMDERLFFQEKSEEPEFLQNARLMSEKLICRAREEADEMRLALEAEKSSWEQERLVLEEKAREEGYKEGLNYGRQDGLEQMGGLIQEANRLVSLSREDYLERIASSEETIVSLAARMAEKVIGSILEDNPDKMKEMVKQLLKEVKDYDEIKIFVHPDRYEYVRSQKEELKQLLTTEQELFLYMDDSLSSFDCYVESSFGRIDASVETQLSQLEQQLLERLGEGGSS
ncbi:flagellar assembly protein FliH [Metabacillus sp. 84]|uniref:flagellar assembly protein FliH n=1 Tax=Metabacillus sp. 84 TaxID=3404705 RepID=UPI003CF0A1F3